MLEGDKVTFRARLGSDVPMLHAELYEHGETRSWPDTKLWCPVADPTSSPDRVADDSTGGAFFSVVAADSGDPVGDAHWGIDLHNRVAAHRYAPSSGCSSNGRTRLATDERTVERPPFVAWPS